MPESFSGLFHIRKLNDLFWMRLVMDESLEGLGKHRMVLSKRKPSLSETKIGFLIILFLKLCSQRRQ